MDDKDDERIAEKEARIAKLQAEVRKIKKQQRQKAEKARVQRCQNTGATLEELLCEEIDESKAATIADGYRAAKALADALGVERLTVEDAKAVAELAQFGKTELERRRSAAQPQSGERIWAGEPRQASRTNQITGQAI